MGLSKRSMWIMKPVRMKVGGTWDLSTVEFQWQMVPTTASFFPSLADAPSPPNKLLSTRSLTPLNKRDPPIQGRAFGEIELTPTSPSSEKKQSSRVPSITESCTDPICPSRPSRVSGRHSTRQLLPKGSFCDSNSIPHPRTIRTRTLQRLYGCAERLEGPRGG